jgi:superfamily II DNA or RNA helicase
MGGNPGDGSLSHSPHKPASFSDMEFRYPFRKYQSMMLHQSDARPESRKLHIVAPPGSGKTIVGLELARRFGQPTVVFAPTTTIQTQWVDKVGMFVNDPSVVDSLASLDPADHKLINVFTYQLISTPGEAVDFGCRMAETQWANDLMSEGHVEDEGQARDRIATIRSNNPKEYDKELRRRYTRVKRDLLSRDDVDIAPFLHPNARKLIDDLVALGIKTIILDECHHLLDYWAIVLRHLIKRIGDPVVIGLTATLPSLDDDDDYENYTSLLGDVDFEVPTPAVVKEGDLAPYRDLVYFVHPTPRETNYLKNIQEAFEASTAAITGRSSFREWVIALAIERHGNDGQQIPLEQFLDCHPILSVAAIRYLRRIGHEFPADFEVPEEAESPVTLDDWAILLERYAFERLKVSSDPRDHEILSELKRSLRPFGLTLTEKGLRQTRSAGDLLLSLSESKDAAVAKILDAESRALGDGLRAIVVTDFERMTTLSEDLKDVVERDAGSAWRVFRSIVRDEEAGKLDPILVTGKTVMADADLGDRIIRFFNEYLQAQGWNATCSYSPTPYDGMFEVVGHGPDWSSRVYVSMVTEAFERGLTKCLVGTRGIFGEGWDSISLNTLIDLTSVTTSTSVRQLRGRSIRKDPSWPRKVAHNWDVICVAPAFERGDSDLRRFVKRHSRYWGIVCQTSALSNRKAARGQVVKGVAHVDPDLAFRISLGQMNKIDFKAFNMSMMKHTRSRDRTYDLWGVGDEYSNFSYSASRLDARDLKFRTVYTMKTTLIKMLKEFRLSVAMTFFLCITYGINLIGLVDASLDVVLLLGIILIVSLVISLVVNVRSAYRLARKFMAEQPADTILLDVGRAIIGTLRDSQLVARGMTPDYVRVAEQPDSSYEVFLDYASPEDSEVFITAFREVFQPVGNQRYLILRDDSRLPSLPLSPFWFVLRGWYRRKWGYLPSYHPVPKILATSRERAESYAVHWREYVGGGVLIFTYSEAGRKALFEARRQARPRVKDMSFEIWR